eukprot:403357343
MENNTSFPKIVRLSVGGVHFETSIDTLISDQNSMLAAMFSGRHNVQKDEDGRYFIDRDGTHFRYILNYLRDGNTYIPFDNQQLLDELYKEVQFFNLENLLHRLDQERQGGGKKISYTKVLELINFSTKPLQMPGIKFTNISLRYLNLDRSNLRGCDFQGCQAQEVTFNFANLQNCNFNDSNFKNGTFREANLSRSTFIGANFMHVDFVKAVGKDCNFLKAKLSNADMREGDFENSNFNEASLHGANLERANLQFCTLTDTNLDRANISNLRGGSDRNAAAGGQISNIFSE